MSHEVEENQLAAVAQKLGLTKFSNRRDMIGKALVSKTSNAREKEGPEKVSKMMTACHARTSSRITSNERMGSWGRAEERERERRRSNHVAEQ
jgi:hypothetical protein